MKDINQSLIDDFLVLGDKIGSANFFWSFPSKAFQDQIVQKEQNESSLCQNEANIVSMKEAIASTRLERSSPSRAQKMKKLEALKRQENEVNVSLEAMKFNDPAEIKKVQQQLTQNIARFDGAFCLNFVDIDFSVSV